MLSSLLGGFVGWQTIRSDKESTAVATEAGSDQREDGLASPTTDDSTDDAATQSTEDDDNTIEPTQPAVEEDSLAASYGGSYVLPLIDISTDRLTTDDARLALRLDLLDDADCDPCRYVLVYQGQELGEVTLSDNTATTVLDAALDDGPLVATCEASDGSEAGTYRQPGPSTAKIAVATSGAALDVDASVTQTFELIGGDPGSGCRSPWKLDTSYALDGTSDFSITKERPQVIQPKGFVKLDTSVVECGLGEQTCDRQLVLSVLDAGDGNEPAITLTAGSGHCAPIVYTVLVEGSVAGSTDELNAGQTSTLKLGSLSTDPESPSEVSIHATGVEGGCNTGELLSWAVTAELAGAVALARAPAVSNLG